MSEIRGTSARAISAKGASTRDTSARDTSARDASTKDTSTKGTSKVLRNSTLANVYLGLMIVLMYVPILLVIIYSFNESKISSVWAGFSLKWYEELFRDRSMLDAAINSLILATVSSFLAAIIGTLAAVGMPKAKLISKSVIEYISTLPIMIPEIILGMVFLAFFTLLRLPFGMITLTIAHTSFCIPYIYMLVKARLVGIDKSYAEAAKDLGATEWNVFFDITLPLVMPAIVSGMLLSFAMSLDDVVISVFVTGVTTNTLPLKIYTQLKTGVTPKTNALCTLMFVTTLVVLVLASWVSRKTPRTTNRRETHEKHSENRLSVDLVR